MVLGACRRMSYAGCSILNAMRMAWLCFLTEVRSKSLHVSTPVGFTREKLSVLRGDAPEKPQRRGSCSNLQPSWQGVALPTQRAICEGQERQKVLYFRVLLSLSWCDCCRSVAVIQQVFKMYPARQILNSPIKMTTQIMSSRDPECSGMSRTVPECSERYGTSRDVPERTYM